MDPDGRPTVPRSGCPHQCGCRELPRPLSLQVGLLLPCPCPCVPTDRPGYVSVSQVEAIQDTILRALEFHLQANHPARSTSSPSCCRRWPTCGSWSRACAQMIQRIKKTETEPHCTPCSRRSTRTCTEGGDPGEAPRRGFSVISPWRWAPKAAGSLSLGRTHGFWLPEPQPPFPPQHLHLLSFLCSFSSFLTVGLMLPASLSLPLPVSVPLCLPLRQFVSLHQQLEQGPSRRSAACPLFHSHLLRLHSRGPQKETLSVGLASWEAKQP